MGTTEQKLNKLLQTKAAIKAAIEAKGVMQVGEVFGEYASKIQSISQSGDVVINNQSKSVNVVENGTQTVTADEGYTGLGSVTIKTNVPSTPAVPKTEEKTISIKTNGQTIVEKSPSVDGMTRVTVNVDVQASGGGGSSDWDFSKIGYDSTPQILIDSLNHSEEIARDYNDSSSYYRDSKLLFFPKVKWNPRSCQNMFRNTSLIYMPSNNYVVTNATYMFSNTQIKKIPALETSQCSNFFGMFFENYFTTEVEALDLSSASDLTAAFTKCSIKKITIKNIGKSALDTYDFIGMTYWGSPTIDGAKQSLIDSLLTYSYDRKSNGMPTATIKLSSDSKEFLTPEEIKQIEAKGFTIV